MKFVRRAAPHISLIISAMMLTFLILDRFNDAMGFLCNQFSCCCSSLSPRRRSHRCCSLSGITATPNKPARARFSPAFTICASAPVYIDEYVCGGGHAKPVIPH